MMEHEMTYPKMPTRLDNAEQIMAWLRLLQADGQSFAEEVSAQVAAGTLTEEISSSYLDKFTWLMAATDKAYAAVEEGDLEPNVAKIITTAADASHDLGNGMTQLLFDRLRQDGANANLLLREAQDRHYT